MRIVVALGGNAIQRRDERGTITEQRATVRAACTQLAHIAADGHELVITHGNGPQVGRLMLQDEALSDRIPRTPLDVHVAATQAQLGYLIQQELGAALRRARAPRVVVTLVTQVLVDPADPAFETPSKPVGPHLSSKGAAEFRARGIPVAEVPGGGWRRVVPSPAPCEVVELETVRALLAAGQIPVAAGGGGIAVVREGGALRGVAAVIDKDLTAAELSVGLGADVLLILTDVEHVSRAYGTPEEEPIPTLSVAEARAGVADGTFPRGSMGEKVLAAARSAGAGARAVITSIEHARAGVAGEAGTIVSEPARRRGAGGTTPRR